MPRNKVITRCIPAGMQINLVEDLRDELEELGVLRRMPKNKKRKNPTKVANEQNSVEYNDQLSFQNQSSLETFPKAKIGSKTVIQSNAQPSHSKSHNDEIIKESETKSLQTNDMQDEKAPPQTICNNAGFFQDINYGSNMNENSSVNDKTIQKPINASETSNDTNVRNDEVNLSLKEKILKRIQNKKDKEQLNGSKKNEPVVENIDVANANFNDTGFKKQEVQLSLRDKIAKRLQKNLEIKNSMKNQDRNMGDVQNQQNTDEKCCCTDCDNFIMCPSWCSRNLDFEHSDSVGVQKSYPLLKENIFIKQPEITKIVNNKMILHGVIIPKPIFSLDNTYLDESVQKALKIMNCSSAKDIQSYMWPAVQRGLNVFMIGPHGIGKTLSYLPSLCSFSVDKDEKYSDLLKYDGPIIVILRSKIKRCESLQNLIKSLISNSSDSVAVEVVTDSSGLQGRMCDILVTTPEVLENCLLSETIKLKRLSHIAIEDGHVVFKNNSKSLGNLFKIMNQVQINRPHNKNIQVIVSSEKWSVDIETLLKNLYATPIICFEDFLEAAIYSKTNFMKKNINSKHKLFYLVDILKTNYMTKKTVVFCKESEITNVGEHLQINGVECITISENLIEDEIFENEDMWCSLGNGSFKVLLTTDAVFEKISHVHKAHWLVHLHLPNNWVQFSKRFRCLSANYNSPLAIDENMSQIHSLNSFLILDELCDSQLLDFFDLLTRNSVTHFKM